MNRSDVLGDRLVLVGHAGNQQRIGFGPFGQSRPEVGVFGRVVVVETVEQELDMRGHGTGLRGVSGRRPARDVGEHGEAPSRKMRWMTTISWVSGRSSTE